MPRTSVTLVSVGYEGRFVDEFATGLRAEGVEIVVDVRLNAISRRPGFSKRALRAILEEHGIDYVHERSLGNPRDNRYGFRRGLVQAVETYRRLVEACPEITDRLATSLRGRKAAVLCYEADDQTCHRRIVIERLASAAEI